MDKPEDGLGGLEMGNDQPPAQPTYFIPPFAGVPVSDQEVAGCSTSKSR